MLPDETQHKRSHVFTIDVQSPKKGLCSLEYFIPDQGATTQFVR